MCDTFKGTGYRYLIAVEILFKKRTETHSKPPYLPRSGDTVLLARALEPLISLACGQSGEDRTLEKSVFAKQGAFSFSISQNPHQGFQTNRHAARKIRAVTILLFQLFR